MTRLKWNAYGEQLFQTGVDRGVFYSKTGDGVVWNGLVSVRENPSGGETTAFYMDGYNFLNRSSSEEFTATIEAYTYPDAFEECDGTAALAAGLLITGQPRKPFDFCYRTKIGNEVDGTEHGYKLHLIYNALASPTERPNESVGSDVNPSTFSWSITTKARSVPYRRPSAHFIIDSRDTRPSTLSDLEDILYGTVETAPRMIQPDELVSLFNQAPADVFTITFEVFF